MEVICPTAGREGTDTGSLCRAQMVRMSTG